MKKKLLLAISLLALFSISAYARRPALGVRVGCGFDLSYQHVLPNYDMLEFELGMPGFAGFEAAVSYSWVYKIRSWEGKGTWSWFAGAGLGVGGFVLDFAHHFNYDVYFGVVGRIGIEYEFNFPMHISLDWRPIFGLGGDIRYYTGGLYINALCVGVRYVFDAKSITDEYNNPVYPYL